MPDFVREKCRCLSEPTVRWFYLRFALFLLSLVALIPTARAFSTNDVNTIFGAYNSAFYLQNGTNGYFKNSQTDSSATYFWSQAEEIECVIDYYEWSADPAAGAMITNLLNGFVAVNGSQWVNATIYNDDIMWAVMAFARGGMDTGRTNYCTLAKVNFDATYARGFDTQLGGGLYWNTDRASKNACVNGPGAVAASLIFQAFGDTNYWNKATNLFYWEKSMLFNPATGAIYDNIGTNGVISYWSSTYNQGTFLGAANFVGDTNSAALSANFTMMNLTTGGILPQYGTAGNNSGFNAIFLRWLVRYMRDRNLQASYEPWVQTNAVAAWNIRRSDNLSWCQWLGATPSGTVFYSWDCLASFESVLAATPVQSSPLRPVPANPVGDWPLDAVSGALAADVSGNSNNGVVSGAVWNSSGRIGGCLNFNGINSTVQITNTVDNDFSIAFWVKTTQVAGNGQWYNGAGLVDGDAPGVANDFGTALVGGKFAFGIGNPDTTIFSTSAINDGNWHHCVVTRKQATGQINVYVNGSLQATGTAGRNTLNSSARLLFGAISSGGNYFNGSLDAVKIFNRTLSSGEVAALYNSSVVACSTPPTGLTAVGGNGQVQLNWSAASDATSYNIKRSLIIGGPYTTITNITATTFNDTNLANNKTYYYVVSGVNSVGEGLNSASANASTSTRVAWLKADAISNLVSGASVAVWPDASGYACNAVQPIGTNRPTYVTGAMNGFPVVRFNAAMGNYLWFYRPVQDDFTIICVYQSTQGSGSGNLYYQGAGLISGEVSGTLNDFGTCLFANGVLCAGTGNPDVSANSSAGYNDGHPHILTFTRTKSSGSDILYVDGTLAGTTTGNEQSLTAPNQLVLGAQQSMGGFFTGDIAEVEIFNSVLLAADRVNQENSLKCKYGLSGATIPFTPSGLAGTVGNRQVSLNWNISTGAQAYDIWSSTNGGATYQIAATNVPPSSYVATNVLNGQMNYYRVSAVDNCGSSGQSAVVQVLVPLPTLALNSTSVGAGGSLSISWPSWANDWQLYSATNLASPVNWSAVSATVGTNGAQLNVSVPIGSGAQYFRLAAP